MFDSDDDFMLGFDVVSSPVGHSNTDLGTSIDVNSNLSFFDDTNATVPFFDIQGTQNDRKHYEQITRSYSNPTILFNQTFMTEKTESPIIPKQHKRCSVVFKPFSSFDATEMTVKALKDHTRQPKWTTQLSW